MILPFHELDILSRSVQFKNLSAASQQIGLSQPQLSRIIAKIEAEFHIQLLDRASKRHTTWTPIAHELAKNFGSTMKRLEEDILRATSDAEPRTLKIGSLEGLTTIAIEYVEKIIKFPSIQVVHLDIYDVIELEKAFLEGDLDIILTQREPGRKKYKFSKLIGYQLIKTEGKNSGFEILSEYQLFSKKERKNIPSTRKLVSNSLMVRKLWIENGMGKGRNPSEVYKTLPKSAKSDEMPEEVLLVANDTFSEKLWKLL
jgi:hypothetical protein